MTRLCICEICNCGRHRCRHRPTALYGQGGKTCVLTEYSEKYPVYDGYSPPKSTKPTQLFQGHKGRMDGTTTFKSDFLPYEITRRPGRQQVEYKPKPGEIDLNTTYTLEFNPYEMQPVAPPRPKETVRAASGKMDTVPTYKEDFQKWQVPKRELTKPDSVYHPPSAKFGNSTTFQDDFAPRGLVPRESFKPSSVAKLSDAPFDGVTSNQLSYVPHPLEARYVRTPEQYKPSSQPLQDTTTHREDYRSLPCQLSKSCKPEPTKMTSDAPFQSSTEFRERFQQWPVSKPQFHKSPEYVIPTAHMDLSTTSQSDYIKHNIQPFVSAKPFPRPARSSAPFHSKTTMQDDFKPWVTCRQELVRKPEEIKRAQGKMEDLTTFKAHFIQHQLQPSVSFKPSNAPMRTDAPLEEGTVYRTEFTPKKISVCPASFDCPPGYVFEENDERGHKLFRRLSSK
ncbi:stabilizer of axonemal microtubules 2 [Chanos chanos]|uniref:Stabilizer of axonemal microtubules 2 n=1 Tax=Chanos chanos TaxID=29144 RepID=A0A6J2URR0_CHACN|nr:stabilizer of axonemal microtubules 2 [Chanos chanos]